MSNSADQVILAENTVRLSNLREDVSVAGGYRGQGSITLYDKRTDKKYVEMGFYQHGAGIFTPDRLEFWAGKEVSIANLSKQPALQIRNHDDTQSAIWINGGGFIGSGLSQIGISFEGLNCKGLDQCKPVAVFHPDGTLDIGDIRIDGQSIKARLFKQ